MARSVPSGMPPGVDALVFSRSLLANPRCARVCALRLRPGASACVDRPFNLAQVASDTLTDWEAPAVVIRAAREPGSPSAEQTHAPGRAAAQARPWVRTETSDRDALDRYQAQNDAAQRLNAVARGAGLGNSARPNAYDALTIDMSWQYDPRQQQGRLSNSERVGFGVVRFIANNIKGVVLDTPRALYGLGESIFREGVQDNRFVEANEYGAAIPADGSLGLSRGAPSIWNGL